MKISDIEYTPNPNAVKFIVDQPLTQHGASLTYASIEEATESPLAQELLQIEHVESVYFYGTWLTVTQDGATEWRPLLKKLAVPIRAAERPTPTAAAGGTNGTAVPGSDDPRLQKINDILDDYVRPYLEYDGGGVEVHGLVGNQVMIRYQGACGTCPSATTGTMMAIEAALQREMGDDLEVILI